MAQTRNDGPVSTPIGISDENVRFPLPALIIILTVIFLPGLLNLLGVDFSSPNPLSGAFHHTILEWSAFSAAIFTAVLSLNHYLMTKDVTTPIIGLALLMAGFMDAFHTLAASRLIPAIADNRNLIPFTWALCRSFHSVICLLGVGLLLLRPRGRRIKGELYFVMGIGFFFLALAYIIIHMCAVSDSIPETQFPDALIARPWDIYPLFFYGVSAFIFWQFFKRFPSVFSFSLIISIIPNVVVQLHMAFGSSTLFDNHFNIAHFLKILSYVVPLVGLVVYYTRIYASIKAVEQRFHVAISSASTGILFIDPMGIIRLVNKNIESYFDYYAEDLMGKQAGTLFSDKQRKDIEEKFQETFREKSSHQLDMGKTIYGQRRNGSSFPLEVGVSHIETETDSLLMINLQDITVRMKHQKEIESRTKEIEQLVYTVSHDLKSPVVTLMGFLKCLKSELQEKNYEKSLESLDRVSKASEKLNQLVRDLLQFSRTGYIELKIERFSLSDLVSSIFENFNAQVEQSKIKVVVEDLGQVEGDRERLGQVFENLIGNAVKHGASSDDEACVIVGISDEDGSSRTFFVKDNGPGISKEYQETIFKLFQRLSTTKEGTGVGLAIVKKIVELHGGKVWVESGYGKGCTFFVRLPREIKPD